MEITGERTEVSTTYANPDGTLTKQTSLAPVRIPDTDSADGWQPVDYDLVATEGGFAPKASPANVKFSAGGDGPAVVAAHGTRSLSLSWLKRLPAPTIEANTATYQLDANTKLVLAATATGLEESLVLAAAPSDPGALAKLRFAMKTTHLSIDPARGATVGAVGGVSGPGGKVTLDDAAGNDVMQIDPVTVFDAQRDEAGNPTHVETLDSTVVAPATNNDAPTLGFADAKGQTPSVLSAFLADPATVYPVTIDPSISADATRSTWIQQGSTVTHGGGWQIVVGDQSGNAARGLIHFTDAAYPARGSDVTAATLHMYETDSASCTAQPVVAMPIYQDWPSPLTWANQPAATTTDQTTSTFAHGFSSACAAGWGTWNVLAMVNRWTTGGRPNDGIELRAGTETAPAQDKSFCSVNVVSGTACNNAAWIPYLTVTYNSIPGTPTLNVGYTTAPAGQTVFPSKLLMTMSASATNADGNSFTMHFALKHDPAAAYASENDTTSWTGTATATAGGSAVVFPFVPLSDHHHYIATAYGTVTNGAGGTDTGATGSSKSFEVDASASPATINCAAYPADTWTAQTSGAKCTLSGATNLAGFSYAWDDASAASAPAGTGTALASNWVDASPGGTAQVDVPSTQGWHVLYVTAVDAYGHPATTTSYATGIGRGGLLTPTDRGATQAHVALNAQSLNTAAGGFGAVTYKYQVGVAPGGTFATVPISDVKTYAGDAISGWPLGGTASGSVENYPELNWNLAKTVHAAGGGDGPVKIEACFGPDPVTATCTNINTVTSDTNSFAASAATADLGPGTVSLDTGDFQIAAGDAGEAGMSIGRVATSRRMLTPGTNSVSTTSPMGIFGPGWQASLPGAAIGAADLTLSDHASAGYLTLTGSDGDTSVYAAPTGASGATATYAGLADANDGSKIRCATSGNGSCSVWKMTEVDGTATTWTPSTTLGSDGQPIWTVSAVVAAGDPASAAANTTAFARDTTGRVTRILAPVPAGVTCGPGTQQDPTAGLVAGCQALTLTYAEATTATGTDPASWGGFKGLVAAISYTAFDPAAPGGAAMRTVQVAAYAYDSTGHLRASWDPRITPALKTTYDYDTTGRLAQLTAPGRAAWTMAYDTSGRLTSVARPDPDHGTATNEIAYDIDPTVASPGLPDLTRTATATWGQNSDVPVAGAAIFPASHTLGAPDSNGDYQPNTSDWAYGDVAYTDVNGRVVNHAAYGAGAWQIDSTRYNVNGSATWALSALNRQRALASPTDPDVAPDLDPLAASQANTADRANMLASVWIYNTTGGYPNSDLYVTLGPLHQATLASGATASVRDEVAYYYDQSAPTVAGCPCHLLTEIASGPGMYGQEAAPADVHITTIGYSPIDGSANNDPTSGWVLRAPTTQTTFMSGLAISSSDLVTKTAYNSLGQVVSTQLPGSSGTDAAKAVIAYYTAASGGACGGHPEWAGLPCQSSPAAQPAGVTIPSTVTTYDLYLNPATVTDTSGSSTRTTTTSYDAAERPIATAITANPTTDAGTALPATTFAYDPTTGDPISQSTGTAGNQVTLTSVYNTLGQQTSYTDADGVTSTNTYDIDGRISTVDDGQGVTTYRYDGAGTDGQDAVGKTEHRGLLTSLDAGMNSAATDFAHSVFTGAYDADGNLTTQTYPNGLVATTHVDGAGRPSSLSYAKKDTNGNQPWLTYTATRDPFGQTIAQTSPTSAQQFTYDRAGRLTQTIDDYQGTCVTRAYGFAGASGMDSDRTSLRTSAPVADAGNPCTAATGGTTITDTFDTADRITSAGYSYDKFGRTLTVPAAGLGNNTVTTGTNPGGVLNVGYYANDMVATQTQGAASKSFALDPAARLRGAIDSTSGVEKRRIVNHYSDGTDSPSWIATSLNAGNSWTWERTITGLDGNLAVLQQSDTNQVPQLQLTNLHGDVVATVPDTTGAAAPSSLTDTTEFGVARNSAATQPRYGWVGGKQRSADGLAGVVLMGARLYNPSTGRFLSIDPIYGGNANAYTYPLNPIDQYDLNGEWHWTKHKKTSKPVGYKAADRLYDQLGESVSVNQQLKTISSIIPGAGDIIDMAAEWNDGLLKEFRQELRRAIDDPYGTGSVLMTFGIQASDRSILGVHGFRFFFEVKPVLAKHANWACH